MNQNTLTKAIKQHPEHFHQGLLENFLAAESKIQKLTDRINSLMASCAAGDKLRRNVQEELRKTVNKLNATIIERNRLAAELSVIEIEFNKAQQTIREQAAIIKEFEQKEDRLAYLEKHCAELESENTALLSENTALHRTLDRAQHSNSQTGGYSSTYDVGTHSVPEHLKRNSKKAKTNDVKAEPQPADSQSTESKPAEPEKKKRVPISSRTSSGKKRGGQPGHSVHKRSLSEYPDVIVEKKVKKAPTGAQPVYDENGALLYYAVQEADIEIKSKITEIRFYPDPNGEELSEEVMTSWKVNPVVFSTGYKSVSLLILLFGSVSYARTKSILGQICPSLDAPQESTLRNWLREFAKKAQKEKALILEEILNEPVVHVDETGVKISGEHYWAHTLCTEKACWLTVTKSRSDKEKGPIGILKSGDYSGKLVHDHFKPYLSLEKVEHCECLVHIERYMRGGVEYDKCPECQEMLDLLHEMHHERNERKAKGKKKMTKVQIKKYTSRWMDICRRGMERWEDSLAESPSLAGYQPNYYPTFRRMMEDPDHYLRFLSDFAVPYGNNLAERQVGAIKSCLKVKRQFVTEQGAADTIDFISMQQTWKLSKRGSILDMISSVFCNGF